MDYPFFSIGNTSSKGPFSFAMSVSQKWVFMGYNPQESLPREHQLNTMGTLLGVHPIVP